MTNIVHQYLLRHSFGTNTTIAGVSQTALQDMLGHSSAATTRIYQNYAAEYLVRQSEKFSALVTKGDVHKGVLATLTSRNKLNYNINKTDFKSGGLGLESLRARQEFEELSS